MLGVIPEFGDTLSDPISQDAPVAAPSPAVPPGDTKPCVAAGRSPGDDPALCSPARRAPRAVEQSFRKEELGAASC